MTAAPLNKPVDICGHNCKFVAGEPGNPEVVQLLEELENGDWAILAHIRQNESTGKFEAYEGDNTEKPIGGCGSFGLTMAEQSVQNYFENVLTYTSDGAMRASAQPFAAPAPAAG